MNIATDQLTTATKAANTIVFGIIAIRHAQSQSYYCNYYNSVRILDDKSKASKIIQCTVYAAAK